MKPVSPELLALLATRQFFVADLYTFSGGNLGSTVLRYCSGDGDVTANGLLYSSGGLTGPYFDRQSTKAVSHQKIGTEVDTMVFDVIAGTGLVMGVKLQTAVRYGLFDGAELLLERAYMPTYGDTRVGTIRQFSGRVSSIDAGRTVCTFSVSSWLEMLNIQMPRNVYQATCRNNLGDVACGVNKESFKTTATVVGGSTTALLLATLVGSFPAGSFDQGKVTFTSGGLNGLSATIRKLTYGSPASIQLLSYLPTAPLAADTLKVYFGCDKTLGANGCPKFSNTARYRAERLIPQPVTAV